MAACGTNHSTICMILSEGRQPVLHVSYDTGELSQWLCYDDSAIDILILIVVIINIIIIVIIIVVIVLIILTSVQPSSWVKSHI